MTDYENMVNYYEAELESKDDAYNKSIQDYIERVEKIDRTYRRTYRRTAAAFCIIGLGLGSFLANMFIESQDDVTYIGPGIELTIEDMSEVRSSAQAVRENIRQEVPVERLDGRIIFTSSLNNGAGTLYTTVGRPLILRGSNGQINGIAITKGTDETDLDMMPEGYENYNDLLAIPINTSSENALGLDCNSCIPLNYILNGSPFGFSEYKILPLDETESMNYPWQADVASDAYVPSADSLIRTELLTVVRDESKIFELSDQSGNPVGTVSVSTQNPM